jgi:dihydroneopterin aldolase
MAVWAVFGCEILFSCNCYRVDDLSAAPADYIHVEQLEVFARVGVTDQERAKPQRLTLNITAWPSLGFENLQDDIQRTANYSELCALAREFVMTRKTSLIETLVSELALYLLERLPLREVQIELRKFVLPDAKYAAVVVTRSAAPH